MHPGVRMRVVRTRSAFFVPRTRPGRRSWCHCDTAGCCNHPSRSTRVSWRHGSRPGLDAGYGDTRPDAHLLNFGGFATPERRLIFDINDLDETLPTPWEWDLKRLVASFVLAARANGRTENDGRNAAVACAASYRHAMRDFTAMDVLDIWYARLDDSDFLARLPKDREAILRKRIAKASRATVRSWCFRSSWR
jgi:Uncharacterized protein conserved in bacteria (DUF2252)